MMTSTLTAPNTPTTITTSHTLATPPCGLNPNRICREESDTPQHDSHPSLVAGVADPQIMRLKSANVVGGQFEVAVRVLDLEVRSSPHITLARRSNMIVRGHEILP